MQGKPSPRIDYFFTHHYEGKVGKVGKQEVGL